MTPRRRQRGFLLNPARFSVGGVVPFSAVSLQLHCDGTNGSTTFTDSSSNGFTGTASGNAQLTTLSPIFGSASGLFDGTGDYVSFADDSAFDLGNGDFTIECWHTPTAFQDSAQIAGSWGSSGNFGWLFLFNAPPYTGGNNSNIRFVASQNGFYDGGTIDCYGGGTGSDLTVNVPNHIAVCRATNYLTFFVNGVALTTTQIATQPFVIGSVTVFDSSAPLTVGGQSGQPGVTGKIDEFRLTKGYARYSASFTPPAAPFPDS
jgi:hypothetical protein